MGKYGITITAVTRVNMLIILFIASTACPVWRNLWGRGMELLLQLWRVWTCSLNLVKN